jgi:hypothetical protein
VVLWQLLLCVQHSCTLRMRCCLFCRLYFTWHAAVNLSKTSQYISHLCNAAEVATFTCTSS